MRTVLFGLDGATFTILDPLVSEGVMPRLGQLYREGVRGTLRSTPIPITPQAWTTMATGRSAGYHGVHDFFRPQVSGTGVYYHSNDSRDNHCEPVWQHASRSGLRATVLNYIGVAPPVPINGHSMPGFVPGRYLRRSSYPRDLFARLEQVPNFDVKILGLDLDVEQRSLEDMEPAQWADWIRHHIARERAWFGVLDHLMEHEPSDLTAIVFDGVDKIQHLAYRLLDPACRAPQLAPWEAEALDLCRMYFRNIDEYLGRTIDRLGDSGRVFIASDHGFTASHEIVYVNKWLHDAGYLTWRGEVAADEKNSLFGESLAHVANAIDFPRTTAYALTPSSNGIFIQNVPASDYATFRQTLIAKLRELRGPDGGRIVTGIQLREDSYPGPYQQLAPDLILTLRDHGFISVINSKQAVVPRAQIAGTHHPDGVILGTGPGLMAGADAGRFDILDVAPLLLHSLELEIPQEYEGRFPAEMYDRTYLASHPALMASCDSSPTLTLSGVETSEIEADLDEEDQAILMGRLRSLGYVE